MSGIRQNIEGSGKIAHHCSNTPYFYQQEPKALQRITAHACLNDDQTPLIARYGSWLVKKHFGVLMKAYYGINSCATQNITPVFWQTKVHVSTRCCEWLATVLYFCTLMAVKSGLAQCELGPKRAYLENTLAGCCNILCSDTVTEKQCQ